MADLDSMFSPANLRRAYRWLIANPDARYKSYFRDSYSAYAISSAANLQQLRGNLKSGRYGPTHASKVYVPKASGLLRPISLLTVDDQIVYQAAINVVADKLFPRTKKRYRTTVFNHLYAGPRSTFFYLKWQDSYRAFGNEIRSLHALGFTHVANFDLASFYDTIDHRVLRHFLQEMRLDADFCDFLLDCLRMWTSSTWNNRSNAIYHGHGIPQGPLSSGMLSEAVLQHIDAVGERGKRTRYLRYVDDIKIFARDEGYLRQKLIALDLCAKEVGLFPQASKINIRRMIDPENEIKSVSRPPEYSLLSGAGSPALRKRVLELTRGDRVQPQWSTRFKYVLGHVKPHHSLNERLLAVLTNQPEYVEAIANYFSRYQRIPAKAAQRIIRLIRGQELYHAIQGELLRACLENFPYPENSILADFCYDRLFRPRAAHRAVLLLPPQPIYKEALQAWVLRNRRISFQQLETLRDDEVDWWVRKTLFRELDAKNFGQQSYAAFVNDGIRHAEREFAFAAVAAMIESGTALRRPYGDVNYGAKPTLKIAGIIRSVSRPPSVIGDVFAYILRRPATGYDWRGLIGSKHRHAERIAVTVKQKFEVDIDACVVRLDSLFDLILEILVGRIAPSAGYKYGPILYSPPAALRTQIPRTLAALYSLHQLRLRSFTAHPRAQRTGSATRRLKHWDYRKIRPPIVRALDEIEATIVP